MRSDALLRLIDLQAGEHMPVVLTCQIVKQIHWRNILSRSMVAKDTAVHERAPRAYISCMSILVSWDNTLLNKLLTYFFAHFYDSLPPSCARRYNFFFSRTSRISSTVSAESSWILGNLL
jgi:hypothetical protein